MTQISLIQARDILVSQGHTGLEVEVCLNCGALGRAAVPLPERPSSQEESLASQLINDRIHPLFLGQDALNQRALDDLLARVNDLPDRARLAVSLAMAQAAAFALDLPFHRYAGGLFPRRRPLPLVSLPALSAPKLDSLHAYLLPQNSSWDASQALRRLHAVTCDLCLEATASASGSETWEHRLHEACSSLGGDLALALECRHPERDLPQLSASASLPSSLVRLLILPSPVELPAPWNGITAACRDGLASLSEPRPGYGRLLELSSYQSLTQLLDESEAAKGCGGPLVLDAQAPGLDPILPAELALTVNASYLMCGSLMDSDATSRYNHLLRLA